MLKSNYEKIKFTCCALFSGPPRGGVQEVHCTGAHDQKRGLWKHHGTILHHIASLC